MDHTLPGSVMLDCLPPPVAFLVLGLAAAVMAAPMALGLLGILLLTGVERLARRLRPAPPEPSWFLSHHRVKAPRPPAPPGTCPARPVMVLVARDRRGRRPALA